VVECARLESVFRRKADVGSNPTLSAKVSGNNAGIMRGLFILTTTRREDG
jgi:hypothetical protein